MSGRPEHQAPPEIVRYIAQHRLPKLDIDVRCFSTFLLVLQ